MSLAEMSDADLMDDIRSMKEALRMYQREVERREHAATDRTVGLEEL